MSNGRVAFVTSREHARLTDDDRLAVAALEDLGIACDAAVWDDPSIAWQGYGAIVLRSTWDYHRRLARFLDWVAGLEHVRAPLYNRPATIRWNADKRYLAALTAAPLAPPPTRILESGRVVDVLRLFDELDVDEAVVKAAVSADGHDTELISRERAADAQAIVDRLVANGNAIAQPLVAEIRSRGELSLMFFGGVFSHAIRKRPGGDEFRVQERLGGVNEPAAIEAHLRDTAASLLARVAPDSLYARIDVVETAVRPVLMEIELIEPSLFLSADADAPASFARAIRDKLARSARPEGA